LQPVGTAILSYFVLDTIITGAEVVGGVLVALGLCVTVWAQNRESLSSAASSSSLTVNDGGSSSLSLPVEGGDRLSGNSVQVEDEEEQQQGGAAIGRVYYSPLLTNDRG